jgi:hypothetical protein
VNTPACHSHGETRIRWHPRPDGLEESVQFTPGYNCPVQGGKGHGVHGMEVTWHLRGPKGAVWLAMCTDWLPGKRWAGHGLSPSGQYDLWDVYPAGRGLGYCAHAPVYEGQEGYYGCEVISGRCYSDTHLSGADEPVKLFVAEGEQAIWDALESAYEDLPEPPEVSA